MDIPTVQFGNYDSEETFGMILSDYSISPATKKTHYVSVPGRNGDLDLSDYLGEAYENRKIEIVFLKKILLNNINSFQSELENSLNGKQMRIVFSNDEEYYWFGRISIDKVEKIGNRWAKITINVTSEPHKVHLETGEKVL